MTKQTIFIIHQILLQSMKQSQFDYRHLDIDDESPSSSHDTEYVNHLKSQCTIRFSALKTAQNLIAAYQKENECLKNENQSLKDIIKHNETLSQNNIALSKEIDAIEKTLYKYTQRINELLESEIEKDKRIAWLEKEVKALQDRENRFRETEKERYIKREKDERRKKKGEQKFNNFLKFPLHEESFISMNSRLSLQQESVLQSQLKSKDAQIMALLRRLRDVQEQLREKTKKERLKTTDTVIHNSIRKNTYSSIEE